MKYQDLQSDQLQSLYELLEYRIGRIQLNMLIDKAISNCSMSILNKNNE